MTSLLGDLWFWISAGGFLLSAVLFVFLLGQYRAAVEAEDDEPEADLPQPVPVVRAAAGEKVYVPKASVSADPLPAKPRTENPPEKAPEKAPEKSPVPEAEPQLDVVPAPKALKGSPSPRPAEPAAAPASAAKKDFSTTGGLSPAVVYLQNLKGQMERLDKDLVNLKQFASQQAAQSEGILKALVALAQKVDAVAQSQKSVAEAAAKAVVAALPAAQAAQAEPEPEPAPAPVAAAQPQPAAEPEPAAPEPEPAPAPSLEPAAPAPEPEPAAAEPEPEAEPASEGTIKLTLEAPSGSPAEAEAQPKPARKGPVWPI